MVHQLFATLRSYFAIATFFLLVNKGQCISSEYIFTAPPEVDREVLEIPASETEYPLYECESDTETESETALDSHQCNCIDCEEVTQDSESDEQLTYKKKQTR